jgi:hypothetical protein
MIEKFKGMLAAAVVFWGEEGGVETTPYSCEPLA